MPLLLLQSPWMLSTLPGVAPAVSVIRPALVYVAADRKGARRRICEGGQGVADHDGAVIGDGSRDTAETTERGTARYRRHAAAR